MRTLFLGLVCCMVLASFGAVHADEEPPVLKAIRMKDHKALKHLLKEGFYPDQSFSDEKVSTALGYAVETDFKSVKLLVKYGADINLRSDGLLPLENALLRGDSDLVEWLLDEGADPNLPARDGASLLVVAIESGQEEMAERLLEAGADPNGVNLNGDSAVMVAEEKGFPRLVKKLIKAGGRGSDQDASDQDLLNQLLYDEHVDLDLVKDVLKNGADPNQRMGTGQFTLLLQAVYLGNEDLVELLLDYGADPNLATPDWGTPICRALKDGHADIIEQLLDAGALDVFDPEANMPSPLLHAIEAGHEEAALKLYAATRRKGEVSEEHLNTAFMRAFDRDLEELEEELLKAGADPDTPIGPDYLPLDRAVSLDLPERAERLVRAGADPHRTTSYQESLFEWASVQEYTGLIQTMTRHGFDVNRELASGARPLHYVLERGQLEQAEILARAGADISMKDARGRTPFMASQEHKTNAARQGYQDKGWEKDLVELAEWCLDQGAAPSWKDEDGQDLLARAYQRGHFELFEFYLDEGCDPNAVFPDGIPLLQRLVEDHQEKPARMLLKKGANPNLVNASGKTVLDIVEGWRNPLWGELTSKELKRIRRFSRLLKKYGAETSEAIAEREAR